MGFPTPTRRSISIHAPREGGDPQKRKVELRRIISIHAPREGGDYHGAVYTKDLFSISIHAPREGGDCMSKAVIIKLNISIHAPREGGDFHILPRAGAKSLGDFNPRPPRGGRLFPEDVEVL